MSNFSSERMEGVKKNMIEIKLRNVCGSCRAFKGGFRGGCELGYTTKMIMIDGLPVNAKPLEPCPKPLTNADYIDARNNYNNRIKKY